jgi:hypothetical protein
METKHFPFIKFTSADSGITNQRINESSLSHLYKFCSIVFIINDDIKRCAEERIKGGWGRLVSTSRPSIFSATEKTWENHCGVRINEGGSYNSNKLYFVDDFILWGHHRLEFDKIRTAEHFILEEIEKIKQEQGS